ncbi:MFS transporter [Prauserella marina]|uniref:Predicted arabinose efflux permease, MFS family n=1 Tax=Prauserella marina TaxID=530584 RepID=A0A222VJT4_9PSEU|nr:MFS transporter [Prauserella marina]ASR34175.1 MFS transporter [Prauserella marina]PWV70513.1 putative MFS family arabinose efflux permease [Prauserella marina]SDE03617.1 Predicted arabinose efflux permease, MFS family [Prauserella marina]
MKRHIRLLDSRPLRTSRPFRDLWIGSSCGALGQQIAVVAVLAQVWELTRSPLWTGAIGIATAVPMLVFGLVGGTLADTFDRRALVRVSTAGQLLTATGLAVQAATGNASVLLLLALVSAQAGCAALGAPARRTFPVRLLPADQVAAGLALQNVAFQAAMLLGPALAGVVIAQWHFTAAYLLEAGTVLIALVTVIRLPAMPPPRPDERSRRPARGGWRIIARRPALSGSFATDLAQTLLAMPIALFPLVNEIRFDGNPRTLGLFLTAIAVGGITAGMFSGTFTRIRRSGVVQLAAAFCWGAALAGFGVAGPLWLALALLAVAGAADTVSVITRGAIVQLETPDKYRGRVSSVEHVIGVAGPEAGNFRGGFVASLTSASFALVAGGLAAALAVGVIAATNRSLRAYRTPAPEPRLAG